MMTDQIQTHINPEANRRWRTKAEMAEYYHCHIKTIGNLMKRRVLPYVKVRRFVRFDVTECDLAMEKFKRRSDLL